MTPAEAIAAAETLYGDRNRGELVSIRVDEDTQTLTVVLAVPPLPATPTPADLAAGKPQSFRYAATNLPKEAPVLHEDITTDGWRKRIAKSWTRPLP